MSETLTFEAFYPHPPERIWQALTDPKALAQWLLPGRFRARIGFRFHLEGGRKAGVVGEVLEADPLRRLTYTWHDEDEGLAGTPSVVSWTLDPRPGGTRVRLEHTVTTDARPAGDHVLIEAGANWRYALSAPLPTLLRLLASEARRAPVPVVYVADEAEKPEPSRRAGFRQEEDLARC